MKKYKPRYSVIHYNQINGSPHTKWLMAMRDSALPESGHMNTQMLLSWDNPYFAVMEGEEIHGFLVYTQSDWQGCMSVILGYIKPNSRRKGLYTLLWQALVKRAQEKGIKWILGATHPDNFAMNAVMEKHKRKPSRILYEYEVATP